MDVGGFLLPLLHMISEKLKIGACYLAEEHPEQKKGKHRSGQVQRSQRNNQRIPATLRCSILVTAIWDLLLRSLQSRLYLTKVCQHSPPRSEKTS